MPKHPGSRSWHVANARALHPREERGARRLEPRAVNPAFDIAARLPSLALERGPAPEEVARLVPDASDFAAALAGFFGVRAGLAPLEGAPLVRDFELAQLEVALPWACSVLDLPAPDR